jgi:hypothetical protein
MATISPHATFSDGLSPLQSSRSDPIGATARLRLRPDPSAAIRRDCWPPSPVPEGETRLVLFRPVNRRSSLVLSRATSGADRSAGAELAARASAQMQARGRRWHGRWFGGRVALGPLVLLVEPAHPLACAPACEHQSARRRRLQRPS